jgi:hypothetical protein
MTLGVYPGDILIWKSESDNGPDENTVVRGQRSDFYFLPDASVTCWLDTIPSLSPYMLCKISTENKYSLGRRGLVLRSLEEGTMKYPRVGIAKGVPLDSFQDQPLQEIDIF